MRRVCVFVFCVRVSVFYGPVRTRKRSFSMYVWWCYVRRERACVSGWMAQSVSGSVPRYPSRCLFLSVRKREGSKSLTCD